MSKIKNYDGNAEMSVSSDQTDLWEGEGDKPNTEFLHSIRGGQQPHATQPRESANDIFLIIDAVNG